MSRFIFHYPVWRDAEPSAWLRCWAALYAKNYGEQDNKVHKALIDKKGLLTGDDFELIGQWKDGALPEENEQPAPAKRGKWRPLVAMVAYDVWMEARKELPKCPSDAGVVTFLEDWSNRKFRAWIESEENGQEHWYKFGLPRATTLLHFLSSGEYPIIDSNVIVAMKRLGAPVKMSVTDYLQSYCLLISELATVCDISGQDGLRTLDNALVCYGGEKIPVSMIDIGCT